MDPNALTNRARKKASREAPYSRGFHEKAARKQQAHAFEPRYVRKGFLTFFRMLLRCHEIVNRGDDSVLLRERKLGVNRNAENFAGESFADR